MHALADFMSSPLGLFTASFAAVGAVIGFLRLFRKEMPSRRVTLHIAATFLCFIYAASSLCLLLARNAD